MKVGRNEPCPCGSGQKYKKCCFQREAEAEAAAASEARAAAAAAERQRRTEPPGGRPSDRASAPRPAVQGRSARPSSTMRRRAV